MKHFSKKKPSPLNMTPGGSNHSQRNSFDMGFHSYFTSPAGMLLPIYSQDVQPGDFLKLDVQNFSRTMPVNTAAFSRFKEVTDFYFIPYRLLWRWYDQLYTGVNDVDTSLNPSGWGGDLPYSTVPPSVPHLTSASIAGVLAGTVAPGLDMFGYPVTDGAERLLDMLGYPVSNDSSITTRSMYEKFAQFATPPTFNPFRLLAYQKLYYDYYRNTDYDQNAPKAYNIDIYPGGGAIADGQAINNYFTPRYVQWKRDRFTTVKPAPLSTFSSPLSSIIPQNSEGLSSTFVTAGSSSTGVNATGTNPTLTNLSELRASLAYDKLARLTMLTPKLYEEQLKSHFGVKPSNCDYCKPRYLGSFDDNLNIGEVTATASGTDNDGSQNVLGQIAGKGIVSGRTNHSITAQFDEPGIVMGMHYFIPFSEYDSNRVDDFNIKLNRNDYYVPEYDNLGLQHIKGATMFINPSTPDSAAINRVLGYQTRYMEYKTRVDEVHSEFQSGKPLRMWCTPRTVLLSSGLIGASSLHVNPKISDSIFALGYSGKAASDPFMCHFRFDATLVRNMSMLGIPSF